MENKSPQRSFALAGPKKTEPISQLEGYLDHVGATTVGGWAWNPSQPDAPAKVEIYDGTTLLATVTAAEFREDLKRGGKGNGRHGFIFKFAARLQGDELHNISAKFADGRRELTGSPKIFSPKA